MPIEVKVSRENAKLAGLVARIADNPNGPVAASEIEALVADRERGIYSLQSLEVISNYLRLQNGKESLSDYLVSSKSPSALHFPQTSKTTEPSEELVKRREYLKLRAEAREYNQMMYGRDEDPRVAEILDAGNNMSSARNQLAVSANMVISCLASFAIAYYAGKSFKASLTTSLVCGLLGAIAILLIEMTLFIVRAMRVESTTQRDFRRVEAVKQSSGLAPTAIYTPLPGATLPDETHHSEKEIGAKKND